MKRFIYKENNNIEININARGFIIKVIDIPSNLMLRFVNLTTLFVIAVK